MTLRLEEFGTLEVVVRDRDGFPSPAATVRLVRPTDDPYDRAVAQRARSIEVDVHDLASRLMQPGTYDVMATSAAEGGEMPVGTVVVHARETTHLDVQLR